MTRKLSAARKNLFYQLFESVDWMNILQSTDDLDSCASLFTDAIYFFYDKCFPTRIVRLRSCDPPWLKPSLKVLIDDRDRAYSRGQTMKYFRLREEVIRHTRHLKEKYLLSTVSTLSSRDSWKSLRLVGRFKRSPVSDFPVEVLNSHFHSYFQTEAGKFSLAETPLPSHVLCLSISEVCEMLHHLKNKSPGPDGIPAWVFRELATILAPSITFIFNWSLRAGHVPQCFKLANITPIPKCSAPSTPSDFRPISLLPILSKVLEKIVARKWILPRISTSINLSQYAYIPGTGGGTTTALTCLQHEVLQFLDSSSGAVRVLSIDFAKAFDKILHTGVLEAVCRFQLPKEAATWISSFLSGRLQRVSIKGKFSSWQTVTSGVPQGSVIGPLLFCMFVDDLSAVLDNSSTFKYADDLTILHFVRRSSDDKLQLEYENVLRWANDHSLPINESKCSVLDIVTSKSLVTRPVCGPEGTSLPHVPSISLLGITLSDDLKWSCHINKVLSKANKRVFLLRNLRRSGCLPTHMLNMYNTVIRPVLLYAYPSFCNFPRVLQEKLLKFERRVFRIIGEANDTTVIEAGEELCKRLFEKVVGFPHHPLRQLFSQRRTVTRASMQLRPPKAKTRRLSESFIRFAR